MPTTLTFPVEILVDDDFESSGQGILVVDDFESSGQSSGEISYESSGENSGESSTESSAESSGQQPLIPKIVSIITGKMTNE